MPRESRSAAGRLLPGILALLSLAPQLAGRQVVGDATVAEAIREQLDQLLAAGRIEADGTELASRIALPQIYEEADYQPLWTPERIDLLRELVRESEEDGLRPDDYHRAALERLAAKLRAPGPDSWTLAQADLLATDAFYLLVYQLYLGKVDPRSLDPHWNFELRPVKSRGGIAFVLEALKSGNLREAVAQVRPGHWWYAKARQALADYRALAARGGWPTIPPGRALKEGSTDGVRVPALRRRLAATGDLSGQSLDSEAFDAPLGEAVRAFQSRHRVAADGAVGPGTLAELNVPVEARILQIRVNMERARWVLADVTPGDLVIVDVAGFEVAYLRDQQVLWRSRIQIGKPYRQTPIFQSRIDHVVFNPTWTVPPGIFAKDILPEVRRDPAYLSRKGLDVIDRGGKKVDPASIDWAKPFPYMLRQEPGPDNALGRVKIMFPNPYAVYLHDTPSKSLFEQTERAFSSGCIRVENPLELARLLLSEPEAWSARAIEEAVQAGKIRTVRLREKVPVLLIYWTIDPNVEGHTVFKRDPYGRDANLARALDAAFETGQRPPL